MADFNAPPDDIAKIMAEITLNNPTTTRAEQLIAKMGDALIVSDQPGRAFQTEYQATPSTGAVAHLRAARAAQERAEFTHQL